MHNAADTWAGLALGRLKAIRCDIKFMIMLLFYNTKMKLTACLPNDRCQNKALIFINYYNSLCAIATRNAFKPVILCKSSTSNISTGPVSMPLACNCAM